MPKYRKKPVVVEAEIYKEGMEDGFSLAPIGPNVRGVIMKPYIQTLEGNKFINEGDYIITGVKGERYPCKPDIFEEKYQSEDGVTLNNIVIEQLLDYIKELEMHLLDARKPLPIMKEDIQHLLTYEE